MANKTINMNEVLMKVIFVFLVLLFSLNNPETAQSKDAEPISSKSESNIHFSNTNNINITNNLTKNLKKLKTFIKAVKPKSIYLEQWILLEPHNKKLLKKLSKIAKKNKTSFYLVIGKNTWFGNRGIANTVASLDLYGKYIDGIVLRVEPNKVNVWKDDFKVQILNQILDSYACIHNEAKKRNKQFFVEFPFWFTDFKGPLRSFSEDACLYSDKVIFLIYNPTKLDSLDIKWNDITCKYNIDLTKRATELSDDSISDAYKKIQKKLPFYSNFNGF